MTRAEIRERISPLVIIDTVCIARCRILIADSPGGPEKPPCKRSESKVIVTGENSERMFSVPVI